MYLGIVLFTMSVLILGFAIFSSYFAKAAKNNTDYFLAGRNLGLLPVTFSLIATQLGGGMLLGTTQEAYQSGLFGITYTLSMIIGFLLLATGIAGRLQALNITTTAELFETVYHSTLLKKIASGLSILTLSGILISQIVGSRALLCGIGFDYPALFIFFWLSIITYTMLGGLATVAWANTAQVLYIFFIFSGLFIWTIIHEPTTSWSLSSLIDLQALFTTETMHYHLPTLLMPALFALIEQDLAQRLFAARTKKVAIVGAFCAGILLLLFACIPVYFGMKARLLHLSITPGASPLLPVVSYLSNEFMTVCIVIGILAAISSTADSLLCAISSNITQDFFTNAKQEHGIRIGKWVTLTVGIACLIASYYVPASIIGLIISSYSISVVCLFVPLLAAYYHKQLPRIAAYLSIIAGCATLVLGSYLQIPGIELIALSCSGIGFLIGLHASY